MQSNVFEEMHLHFKREKSNPGWKPLSQLITCCVSMFSPVLITLPLKKSKFALSLGKDVMMCEETSRSLTWLYYKEMCGVLEEGVWQFWAIPSVLDTRIDSRPSNVNNIIFLISSRKDQLHIRRRYPTVITISAQIKSDKVPFLKESHLESTAKISFTLHWN